MSLEHHLVPANWGPNVMKLMCCKFHGMILVKKNAFQWHSCKPFDNMFKPNDVKDIKFLYWCALIPQKHEYIQNKSFKILINALGSGSHCNYGLAH